jgi:hypothetical protein
VSHVVLSPTAKSGGKFTDTIARMNVAADIDREARCTYDFARADVVTTTHGYDGSGTGVSQTTGNTTTVETLDYCPYGALKFDTMTGGFDGESRKFIGSLVRRAHDDL